jgi:Na+/H+-dicarboxylate symporter
MDLPALDDGAGLRVASWLLLPPARQALALRAWLRARLGAAGVPESLVRRLLLEVPALRLPAAGRRPVANCACIVAIWPAMRMMRRHRRPRLGRCHWI